MGQENAFVYYRQKYVIKIVKNIRNTISVLTLLIADDIF